MKKALVLILIAIITIGTTVALVRYFKMDTFSFAWILNFMLMLLVTFFTTALKSPLSSAYFDEKHWEKGGKIYERLGVNFFRKSLVAIGWEKVIRKAYPLEKNTTALVNLHYQTKKSELDHLIILIIALGFQIFVTFKFGIVKSLSLFALNILLHCYPIILQRYNRPRIERAIKLSKMR